MIQGCLRAEFLREERRATIFKVVGADTVERCGEKGHSTKGPAVVICRAGSRPPSQYLSGQQVIIADELPGEFSSTRVREALHAGNAALVSRMCGPSVSKYLFAN